ncbi:TPA: ROK family protein [Clostridium botulinum]|uniref:ROK family protein n=1 Tax=Clostridium botulinum TaxID=1491 RepID=UPI0008FC5DC1|nr:ROK family protein [Clostridium botulinum]APC78815.1 glucokinase family protein [Clostridium botulinum]MBN3376223.1 ROK family protein [Clostridium botulinum]MBN3394585.1 ROK family protein [Clostridium botulinum]MCS4449039.1 ROK family protein [Clostridium botulinum]MCS4456670.1 ROK family protein [Clostridium botulinum]
MNKKYVVGVDLGGTKIYTALVDLDGNIIKEKNVKTEASKGELNVLYKIINTIDNVIEGVNLEEIKAIGIGSPGPLDAKEGIIISSSNLPFENFSLVQPIKDKYNIPTYLDNDANVATLAEFMFGEGKGTKNMIYVTASTGIGAGAIINSRIYRGNTGNALEIGHTTVMKDGPNCGCGNKGCAESLGSGTAIMKKAKEVCKNNGETSLKKYDNLTAKEVFEEAEKGDKVSKEVLEFCLSYLGITVANIINTFDPEMVVIGGGVINGGEIVCDIINREVKNRCWKAIRDNCKITKAKLAGKAGVLGAAALAITESKN